MGNFILNQTDFWISNDRIQVRNLLTKLIKNSITKYYDQNITVIF
jgi:hypothetical protein